MGPFKKRKTPKEIENSMAMQYAKIIISNESLARFEPMGTDLGFMSVTFKNLDFQPAGGQKVAEALSELLEDATISTDVGSLKNTITVTASTKVIEAARESIKSGKQI